MPIVTIKNFQGGMIADPELEVDNAFQKGLGVDIFSDPGRMRVNYQPQLGSEGAASASNDVEGLIGWFTRYDGNASYEYYGLDSSGNKHLYGRHTDDVWVRVSSDGSQSINQGGLITFGTNLYWAGNDYLGKYDGTTYTSNFKELSNSTGGSDTGYKPMKVFAGKLCIGDGRYVATLEADGTTFKAEALTLPLGYRIRCMEVYGERLYIGTYRTTSSVQFPDIPTARIFIWDGISATYADYLELNDAGIKAMIAHDNFLWIFAGNQGRIFVFNGAQLRPIKRIPDVGTNQIDIPAGGVGIFGGNLTFNVTGTTGAGDTIPYGTWQIGRYDESFPYALTYSYPPSGGVSASHQVSGLFCEGGDQGTLFIGQYDGTNYEVDELHSSQTAARISSSYFETQRLSFGQPERKKIFRAIRLRGIFGSGASVQVAYKLDEDASYTNLSNSFSSSNQSDWMPIRKIGRTIQFKFTFTSSGTNDVQLMDFSINYDLLGSYF